LVPVWRPLPRRSHGSPVAGSASAEERWRAREAPRPLGQRVPEAHPPRACWRTASRGCGDGRCPSTSS